MLKRKLTMLLFMLAAAVMLAGACGTTQSDASETPRTSSDMVVVADMDGQHLYMYEFKEWLDENVQGGSAAIAGASNSESLSQYLDSFVSYRMLLIELEKKGYTALSDEKAAEAEKNATDQIAYYAANYGMAEDDYLAQLGITKDELIEKYKFYMAAEAAYSDTALIGDTTPTEDEIKNEYDSAVASAKEKMDSKPELYVTNILEGATTYYVPEGVRMVRNLLVAFDENTAGAIATLRSSGYDEQALLIREDGIAKIQAKVDEIAGKISGGELSFSDALTQYNEDTGMPEEGYPVVLGATDYAEEFTRAAMALVSIGEISAPVATDYGYHLIEYTSDVAQGPATFESVKDTIAADLQPEKRNDAWNAVMDQWKIDHEVVCYYDHLDTME